VAELAGIKAQKDLPVLRTRAAAEVAAYMKKALPTMAATAVPALSSSAGAIRMNKETI